LRVLTHYLTEYIEATDHGYVYAGQYCADLPTCMDTIQGMIKGLTGKDNKLCDIHTSLMDAFVTKTYEDEEDAEKFGWGDAKQAIVSGWAESGYLKQQTASEVMMEKMKQALDEELMGNGFVQEFKKGDIVSLSVEESAEEKPPVPRVENRTNTEPPQTVIPPPDHLSYSPLILREAGDLPGLGGWDVKYAVWLKKSEEPESVTVCVALTEGEEVLQTLYNTMPMSGGEEYVVTQIRDQVRDCWLAVAGSVYESVAAVGPDCN
jgi:hypothetical protein